MCYYDSRKHEIMDIVTFTAADDKVAVDAPETATDNVFALALAGKLACQARSIKVP